jgi:hypothetical protein
LLLNELDPNRLAVLRVSFRHQLFNAIRISSGFVFGPSAISNPIDREAARQAVHQGSAKGFCLSFDHAGASVRITRYRVDSLRSTSFRTYGTLGGILDNANVIGIRHRL